MLNESGKFYNYSVAAYYTFKVLIEKFNSKDIAPVIIKNVFLRPQNQLIRLFINNFLAAKQDFDGGVRNPYEEIILKLDSAERSKLFKVAESESCEHTPNLLHKTLSSTKKI